MNVNETLQQIEAITQRKLTEAKRRERDPLGGLMAYSEKGPKYLLENGRLIGLNLGGIKLNENQLGKIFALKDFRPADLLALNLCNNKLRTTGFLDAASNLRQLHLGWNNLTEFFLPTGMSQLEFICLEGNPRLNNPTPETIQRGRRATLDFLMLSLRVGTLDLYEVKVLIVGEGGSGKTTLWNLLQNRDHPVPDLEQLSTLGIVIKEGWSFEHVDDERIKVLVNLWDFGGQEIQYMTHQFFLTRRSLYILLADVRREGGNFVYWLQIISLLGVDERAEEPLPVMAVLNYQGNVHEPKMPYDEKNVKTLYPKLDIVEHKLDFKKKGAALNSLVESFKEVLCKRMEHLPIKLPTTYVAGRELLAEERKENKHITLARFCEICEKAGINGEKEQKDFSQLLHDLGIILHFWEKDSLADFVVLDPKWAVNAVYEILKHPEVKGVHNGRFNDDFLKKIWEHCGYDHRMRLKLKALMLEGGFDVCFRAKERGNEVYIAPQLLDEHTPNNHHWTEQPDSLRYLFNYPFMPKGIIGHLIVDQHESIDQCDGRTVVWEKGAIFKKNGCRARVVAPKDPNDERNLIRIEVQGDDVDERKGLLRDVRHAIEKVHRSKFPGLVVHEFVPCNCGLCLTSSKQWEYRRDLLLDNKNKNKEKAVEKCSYSHELIPVNNCSTRSLNETNVPNRVSMPQAALLTSPRRGPTKVLPV